MADILLQPAAQTINAQPNTMALKPAPSADTIHVVIRNRSKILFNDRVKAITSYNDTGRFDVLPLHANFISVIKKEIIIQTLAGQQFVMQFDNGVFKVKDGEVKCYIDLLSGNLNETK